MNFDGGMMLIRAIRQHHQKIYIAPLSGPFPRMQPNRITRRDAKRATMQSTMIGMNVSEAGISTPSLLSEMCNFDIVPMVFQILGPEPTVAAVWSILAAQQAAVRD